MSVVTVVTVSLLAAAVGVLTAVQPGAAAAVAAALVLGGVLLSAGTRSGPRDLDGRRFRWVVLAWVYVIVRPIGHFTAGRTSLTAVAGVPSLENLIDLTIHATIAVFALWSLRSNRFSLRSSWLIFALPAVALISAAWSLAPSVTLGFSFELVAICLLATLTAAIYRTSPDLGASILRRALRGVVQVVALLCIIGLIFPHRGGLAAGVQPGDNRFTWPGEHPLVATAEIGFALLVIVFAAHGEAGFSRTSRVLLLTLFCVCLYLGQSRTPFAGLAAATMFGYWLYSKDRGRLHRLAGAGAIAAVVVLAAAEFGGPIAHYLYRGESQQQVFGLNGRLGLWTFAVHQLHSPTQWLFGYGLGATRVLLASSVAWAGDAHGAWIELLLSLGLLGVAVAATVVVILAARLFRTAPDAPLASRVIPILFVYTLAMSPAATGFAAPGPEPGLGFALLAFCYAATATRQPAPSRALARPEVRVARDLRPASI